ncbi:MAG: RNA pseudouridine synthase [Deltaproteobacteria bacterium]|nr:RNA pseudouridine synthase [Deltaproteobacteria bacterium]
MTPSSILVIYEDKDCVVVDKPAGMPSHPLKSPLPPFFKGGIKSAFEAVCELYPEIATASDNSLEGGLVHRLDTGTSGLLVFARNPESYKKLREAFSKGLIKKTYIALVEGEIKEPCVIDYPIAHHQKNKAKMLAITPKHKYFRGEPRPAKTHVTPLLRQAGEGSVTSDDDKSTLIHLTIEGGRRHQIRVHLAAIGHPLKGDVLYGTEPISWRKGHALHADTITLLDGRIVKSSRKMNDEC